MQLDLTDLRPIIDQQTQGDHRVWLDVDLPGLDRSATIHVWLPPGYDSSDERYPVLYLHDGQNLFEPYRSPSSVTWRTDVAMSTLAADDLRAILIGIPCNPVPGSREDEYSPYPNPEIGGGRAADYAGFLIDHLKPAVDAVLRTRPGPQDTVTAGSSMGAVISAYLWSTRPDVFGGAGLLSPAFWVPGNQFLTDLEGAITSGAATGRVYVDVGGHEEPGDPQIERRYVDDAEQLVGILREAGVPVRYTFDSAAYHFESAWAERLAPALAWLLRGYAVPRLN